MRRASLYFLALFFLMPGAGAADIINGSFETGDLSGWETKIVYTSDQSWLTVTFGPEGPIFGNTNNPPITPEEIFDKYSNIGPKVVENSYGLSTGYYLPVDGKFFLELTNVEDMLVFDKGNSYYEYRYGSILSLTQSIYIEKGRVLSGWAAYDTSDFFPYWRNQSWIEIGNGNIQKVLYRKEVADVGNQGHSDWEYWKWVAPSSGTYILSLNIYGDDLLNSNLYVDKIHTPEPSTMLLLGSGLIGLIGFRRKFRK